MTKRDMMGEGVERAARRMVKAIAALHKRLPLGPDLVQLTPAEYRRVAERNPEAMAQIVAQLGPEQALRMLAGRRPKGTVESLFGEEEDGSQTL